MFFGIRTPNKQRNRKQVCRNSCSVPNIHLKAAEELLRIFNLANFYLNSKPTGNGLPLLISIQVFCKDCSITLGIASIFTHLLSCILLCSRNYNFQIKQRSTNAEQRSQVLPLCTNLQMSVLLS